MTMTNTNYFNAIADAVKIATSDNSEKLTFPTMESHKKKALVNICNDLIVDIAEMYLDIDVDDITFTDNQKQLARRILRGCLNATEEQTAKAMDKDMFLRKFTIICQKYKGKQRRTEYGKEQYSYISTLKNDLMNENIIKVENVALIDEWIKEKSGCSVFELENDIVVENESIIESYKAEFKVMQETLDKTHGHGVWGKYNISNESAKTIIKNEFMGFIASLASAVEVIHIVDYTAIANEKELERKKEQWNDFAITIDPDTKAIEVFGLNGQWRRQAKFAIQNGLKPTDLKKAKSTTLFEKMFFEGDLDACKTWNNELKEKADAKAKKTIAKAEKASKAVA